jgi:hypothetical protein
MVLDQEQAVGTGCLGRDVPEGFLRGLSSELS